MGTESITGPIGVFDSGYGGLTILKEIRERLPQYDYIYIGDNARAPYGTRSFDIVYRFTLQAVQFLFSQGCHLVILACNTASAKALRTIQQVDLPRLDPQRRVLGVIRPTVEAIGELSTTGEIGVFATPGTIASQSFDIEIAKLYPGFKTTGHACPMWVPLIENDQKDTAGADYFFQTDAKELISANPLIDTIILGCTHYPLIKDKIARHLPPNIRLVEQGTIVSVSLAQYLARHPELEAKCSKGGTVRYLTTENTAKFDATASKFIGHHITSSQITIN